MKRTIFSILCLALALFIFAACSPAPDQADGGGASSADEDVVVCKIGEDTLYRSEFAALFMPYYNFYKSNGVDFSDEAALKMLQDSIFNSMVRGMVIQQQAAAQGVTLTDAEKQVLEETVNEDYQQFLDVYVAAAAGQGSENPQEEGEKNFLAMLEKDGYGSTEEYRERLYGEQEKIMLADKLKEQAIAGFAFDEAAAKKKYEEDLRTEEDRYKTTPALFEEAQNMYDRQGGVPPLFTPEGYIRVKHILVTSEEMALTLIDRLEAGEDFDTLMGEYGVDPGMKQSPAKEMGYLVGPDTSFVAEFKKAAFALENVGDLSAPVQSSHGYHVIKLVEKLENKALGWEAVKDSYQSAAESSYFEEQIAKWTDETEITSYIGRVRDLGKV